MLLVKTHCDKFILFTTWNLIPFFLPFLNPCSYLLETQLLSEYVDIRFFRTLAHKCSNFLEETSSALKIGTMSSVQRPPHEKSNLHSFLLKLNGILAALKSCFC